MVTWQLCTDIGGADNMINDWDENEFGALDTFEACAHAYHDDATNHGGHTAQDCMQILYDAAFHMDGKGDIVNTIASKLYYEPQEMCQCSEVRTCEERSDKLTKLVLDASAVNSDAFLTPSIPLASLFAGCLHRCTQLQHVQ